MLKLNVAFNKKKIDSWKHILLDIEWRISSKKKRRRYRSKKQFSKNKSFSAIQSRSDKSDFQKNKRNQESAKHRTTQVYSWSKIHLSKYESYPPIQLAKYQQQTTCCVVSGQKKNEIWKQTYICIKQKHTPLLKLDHSFMHQAISMEVCYGNKMVESMIKDQN